ncbi:putative Ig domain-containing protein [Eionea flava]
MRHQIFVISFSFLCLFISNNTFSADYPPNIDYGSAGDVLAKRGGDRGRTSILSISGPLLINNPQESGSSSVGIVPDFTDSAWDLSDLTNPTLVAEHNCFEGTCYRGAGVHSHAHFTRYDNEAAYVSVGRNFRFGTGGWLRYNYQGETVEDSLSFGEPPWGLPNWAYSNLTSPYHTEDYWQYLFAPSEQYSIREHGWSDAQVYAEWDHIGLTGTTGFPIFSGNFLIFASDQQQTGMSIYDISGMHQGQLPRLVSHYNPELVNPNGNIERLGGYWVEPYGANKIVWSARIKGATPRREFPSLFMVDFTDPANPFLSCEIYFDQDKNDPSDGNARSNPMYVNFQDRYAFVDHFKVDLDACENAYRDDQHIDQQELVNIIDVLDGFSHACDSSQYFRPLGQVGAFGGADRFETQMIIEYTGGTMIEGAWHRVGRDGEYGWGFHVGRTVDEGISAIFNVDIQVGDIIESNGNVYTITDVYIDERVNEQGMCFIVTSDAPDTIPPYVSGHRPLANEANVPVDTFIHFHIPETLRSDTLAGAVTVTNTRTNETITFDMLSSHTGTVSIFPDNDLTFGDEYRVDIAGVVQDYMGNMMEPYSFSFTTGESQYQAIDIKPVEPAPSTENPFVANHSGNLACEANDGFDLAWAVNPHNDTVSMLRATIDPSTFTVTTETFDSVIVQAGGKPSSVTRTANWLAVTYSDLDVIRFYHVDDSGTTASESSWEVEFDYGANPVASVAHDGMLYVSLYNSGQIAKIDIAEQQLISTLTVGDKPKAMALTSDGSRLLVTRFISDKEYGEVYDIATAGNMAFRDPLQPEIRVNKVLVPDDLDHGSGVPNYLRSIVISPDDQTAYISANKANVERGQFLNNLSLDDDNTIRPMIAILDLVNHQDSNIDPTTQEGTIDLDNAADPSGMTILPDGVTRVHALQGNNVIAFVNQNNNIYRASTGAAPQSLCATPRNLYVKNFTDRTVTRLDIADHMYYGTQPRVEETLITVLPENDTLAAEELRGLQVFYHARVPDISPEGYMSCASCHDDGGHDGMTWDLTHMGEGLRNTISLRGSSGTRFGNLHWSSNFDEVQDFEAQLEHLNRAEGLIEGLTFTNDVSPLSETTSGISPDLDALAAYVSSLQKDSVLRSPYSSNGALPPLVKQGRVLFEEKGCRDCHTGAAYRDGLNHDVGTITAASGQRLGFALTEIRTPTLVELWDSAPYLHDGSAPTLESVLQNTSHTSTTFTEYESDAIVAFLRSLDRRYYIHDEGEQNTSPVLNTSLSDHSVEESKPIHIALPDNLFSDADNDPLLITASLVGGSELPSWLSFDVANNVFIGEPLASSVGSYDITVSARDGQGAQVSDDFTLVVATDWIFCANEGGTCTVPAEATVRYGASDSYSYQHYVQSEVGCNNLVFGDPKKWTFKHCEYKPTSSTEGNVPPVINLNISSQVMDANQSFELVLPANTFVDADNDPLSISASLVDGENLPGWLTFDKADSRLSGTPLVGDAGDLTVRLTADDGRGGVVNGDFLLRVTDWVFCAYEGQTCEVPATATVRYGIAGFYNTLTAVDNSVACRNDTFGDPIFGQPKQCHYRLATEGNSSPVLNALISDQATLVKTAFEFVLATDTFVDSDNDPLSLMATLAGGVDLPSWLRFDSANRRFIGTPSVNDVATLSIWITADDGRGGIVSDEFVLEVVVPSSDWVFCANEGQSCVVPETATVRYGAADSYNTLTSIEGSLNCNNSVFGDPIFGVYKQCQYRLAFGNNAPTLNAPVADQITSVDSVFEFVLAADTFVDSDNDPLLLSAALVNGSGLPEWLTFDSANRRFSGTPAVNDIATLVVRVTADDSLGGIVSDEFVLEVEKNTSTMYVMIFKESDSDNPNDAYLHLAEVEAYDASNNPLVFTNATMINDYGAEYSADKAIDGNTRGNLSGQGDPIAHTGTGNGNVWWQGELELAPEQTIEAVKLYNRSDNNLARTKELHILILEEDLSGVADLTLVQAQEVAISQIYVETPVTAGSLGGSTYAIPSSTVEDENVFHVMVFKESDSDNPNDAYLHLAEVEAYDASNNQLKFTDAKMVNQFGDEYSADKAIDGNTRGDLNGQGDPIAHTGTGNGNVWWQAQLELEPGQMIDTVKLYNRSDNSLRRTKELHILILQEDLSGVADLTLAQAQASAVSQVYVESPVVAGNLGGSTYAMSSDAMEDENIFHVMVFKESDSVNPNDAYLHLAEVEAYDVLNNQLVFTHATMINHFGIEYSAEKAIDGNTRGDLNGQGDPIAHTGTGNGNVWWQGELKLESGQAIDTVKLYNRSDNSLGRTKELHILILKEDLSIVADLTLAQAQANAISQVYVEDPVVAGSLGGSSYTIPLHTVVD